MMGRITPDNIGDTEAFQRISTNDKIYQITGTFRYP